MYIDPLSLMNPLLEPRVDYVTEETRRENPISSKNVYFCSLFSLILVFKDICRDIFNFSMSFSFDWLELHLSMKKVEWERKNNNNFTFISKGIHLFMI